MGVIIFLVCFCFFFTKVPVRVPGQKKKVVLFVSCPSPWTWHAYRRFILCTESYTRFTSDLPSIRLGYPDLSDIACLLHGAATFVCSCLPTFIPTSSSFRRRWNGTELQFAARIIFALFCRAVRKQIASRREQYINLPKGWRTAFPRGVFVGGW